MATNYEATVTIVNFNNYKHQIDISFLLSPGVCTKSRTTRSRSIMTELPRNKSKTNLPSFVLRPRQRDWLEKIIVTATTECTTAATFICSVRRSKWAHCCMEYSTAHCLSTNNKLKIAQSKANLSSPPPRLGDRTKCCLRAVFIKELLLPSIRSITCSHMWPFFNYYISRSICYFLLTNPFIMEKASKKRSFWTRIHFVFICCWADTLHRNKGLVFRGAREISHFRQFFCHCCNI